MSVPLSRDSEQKQIGGLDFGRRQLFRRPAPKGCPCPYESGIANDGAILGTGTVSNNTMTNIDFADGVSVSAGATAIEDYSGTSTLTPLRLILDGWFLFYVDFEWSGGGYTDVRYYAPTLTLNADNDGNTALGANESAPVEASFHRTWGPLYFRATSLLPRIGLKVKQTSGGLATVTGVLLTVVYLGDDTDPARFPL